MAFDTKRWAKNVRKEAIKRVKQKMRRANLGENLVKFAQRRINLSGDSTLRYPALWDPRPKYKSIRAGKTPLYDKGKLYRSLISKATYRSKSFSYALRARGRFAKIAAAHQKGFRTTGPNYVPLARKAYGHKKGQNPAERGLIRGKHYVVMKNGVRVPPRPIFNWPPEDQRAFLAALSRALD